MTARITLADIRSALASPGTPNATDADATRDVVRWAAVTAILRERAGGPEILLIQRAEHADDPWSGHMAFPGGRHEPDQDGSLEITATRETREEVGLALGETLGVLGEQAASISGDMRVRAFGYVLEGDPAPRPNYEVAEVLWTPLAPLYFGERDTTTTYVHRGQPLEFPAFDIDGREVWGLTYRLIQSLFERLRGPA